MKKEDGRGTGEGRERDGLSQREREEFIDHQQVPESR